MRNLLLAALIAALPATAPAQGKAPEDFVDETLEGVLDTLRFVLRAIPQYEMPEVLPNGDIIIRRIPSEPKPKPRPDTPRPEPKPENGPEGERDGVRI